MINVIIRLNVPMGITIQAGGESMNIETALDGYNVLVFAADGVGNSYFEIKREMEELGATVTTIGLSGLHTSCSNVEDPILIETNTTIKDFDVSTFADYEALILPSGGYWFSMLMQDNLMEFIELAYANDLMIASICIGMILLSGTSIVEGVRMVAHDVATSYLQDAGADMEYYARVVSDKGIISGGTGGGLDGGRYLAAPHEELCLTIARRILGVSYITSSELKKDGSNYTIKVNINEIEDISGQESNISKVDALIYNASGTKIDTIKLNLEDSSYKGAIVDLEPGKYDIRIAVKTVDDIIEVSSDLLSINTMSSIPGFELISTILGLVLLTIVIITPRRKH